LDEPTVGQDYEGLRKMVEILNEIHEETKNTMFTITHDMRCAKSLCDVALLVEDGEIAKVGGPEMAVEYFTAISR
jgi:energy-coupling factor transport system ATP-binding protein